MIVVGGGTTRLGTAVDAVSRGFRTLLLEAHDFASGTSSKATKLVHGGVRYLAQSNISLVRESLHERGVLLRNAPHLAQPLSFVIPAYTHRDRLFYGIGMRVYDALASRLRLSRSRTLSVRETMAALPKLVGKGLRGGVQYSDGQFDDTGLAMALAKTAARQGALVLNYVWVTVRVLLGFKDTPSANCGDVNAVLDQHIGHVTSRVQELRVLERQLRELRSQCQSIESGADCGILKQLSSGVADDPGRPKPRAAIHGHGAAVHGRPRRQLRG